MRVHVELYIPVGLEKRTLRDVNKIMFEGRLGVFYGTKENTVRASYTTTSRWWSFCVMPEMKAYNFLKTL